MCDLESETDKKGCLWDDEPGHSGFRSNLGLLIETETNANTYVDLSWNLICCARSKVYYRCNFLLTTLMTFMTRFHK